MKNKERLIQDVPFLMAGSLLRKLSTQNCLYIITNRQKKDLTIEQINSYYWTSYIKEVLVTVQKTSKLSLPKENVEISKDDVLIGDTGEDIITRKELGVQTRAVASGFLNERILSKYNPNFLVESVAEIYTNGLI